MDFETCNFVDRFMPKHTHYTLTKIQKVKKHNRTPLNFHYSYLCELKLSLFKSIVNLETLILTEVAEQSLPAKVLTFSEGKLTQPDESALDLQLKHLRMETSGLTLMLKIIARSAWREAIIFTFYGIFPIMCAVDTGLSPGVSRLRR